MTQQDRTTDTIGSLGPAGGGDYNAATTATTVPAATRICEDTIVYIDTFLARVTDEVTEVKYDADNHVAKDASLTLTIYDGYNNPVTLTDDVYNYTYAEGDMLLVNAYTADDGDHAAIALTPTTSPSMLRSSVLPSPSWAARNPSGTTRLPHHQR